VTAAPLLEASALAMWRGERCLFRDLDLAVIRGRALHVRGPNGCGKTTLLRILCGLLAPEAGSIRVEGTPVRGAHPLLRQRVGYLGHADGLKMELTVRENLRFAATLTAVHPMPQPERILARMGLERIASLETRRLSAGQRRRLSIGRLVAGGHRLWVLDEPFTALDSAGITLLTGLLEEALDEGVGILFTSHQAAPVEAQRLDVLDLETAAP
jgi:heme exporter protein A